MIGDSVVIRGMELKNRICAGPMGNTTETGPDGMVCDAMVEHFRTVAESGTALIIQGAANISGEYPARGTQTGIWRDGQIPGLRRITEAVHEAGGRIILQLEHAGMRSAVDHPPAPSPFTVRAAGGSEKVCRVMTLDEIHGARQAYIDAGRRAVEAGYDGVELHASHGWLLDDFLSESTNRRDDEYGRDRLLLVREIFAGIRGEAPDGFVIGIRLAGFHPDLETGIAHGRAAEEMGFDYINMSNNPVIKWIPQQLWAPEGYPFTPHEYSAAEMKRAVGIPVLGAKAIRTADQANAVLAETEIDMILVARGMLADPHWTEKALSGTEPIQCRTCPRCTWRLGGKTCAAIKLAGGGVKNV